MEGNHMTKNKKTAKKETPQQVTERRQNEQRVAGLLEELEATRRHYHEVKGKKTIEMKDFNEQLKAIEKREEGILRDIDNIERPLPLIDGMTCTWAGCKKPAIKGEEYCADHKKEHGKLKNGKKSKNKKTPAKPG
jgi:hypothetical protein